MDLNQTKGAIKGYLLPDDDRFPAPVHLYFVSRKDLLVRYFSYKNNRLKTKIHPWKKLKKLKNNPRFICQPELKRVGSSEIAIAMYPERVELFKFKDKRLDELMKAVPVKK